MLIWLLAKAKKSCEYEVDGRGVPACRQISRPEWSWPPRHPPRHPKAEHDPISAAGARPELALIRKRLNVALGGRAAVVICGGAGAGGRDRCGQGRRTCHAGSLLPGGVVADSLCRQAADPRRGGVLFPRSPG